MKTPNRTTSSRHQRGLTAVELMASLSVIAVVAVAVVAAASSRSSEAEMQVTIDRYERITTRIQNVLASRPDYSAISYGLLVASGAVSNEDLSITPSGSTVIGHAWTRSTGGGMTFAVDPTNNRRIQTTFSLVPRSGCLNLASALLQRSYVVGVRIASTTIRPAAIPGDEMSTAISACNAAAGNVDIVAIHQGRS